jgi:uncharacterized protein (TIGR02722 family)
MDRKIACSALLCLGALLPVAGCERGGVRTDESREGLTSTHDLDFKDYQIAAEALIGSLLQSGAIDRSDGLQPILVIAPIRNDTLQHLDTQLLTDKVRIALNKSGKALTTTAVGLQGPEDAATRAVQQDLPGDTMIDPSSLPQAGKVQAPNFSLAGNITQLKTEIGRAEESYFAIHLTLTDLVTRLAVWEDEKEIVKQKERGWGGL